MRFVRLVALALVCMISARAAAHQQVVLTLRDGRQITGTLLAHVPGKRIVVRAADRVWRFHGRDAERVRLEPLASEGAPAPEPQQAPALQVAPVRSDASTRASSVALLLALMATGGTVVLAGALAQSAHPPSR